MDGFVSGPLSPEQNTGLQALSRQVMAQLKRLLWSGIKDVVAVERMKVSSGMPMPLFAPDDHQRHSGFLKDRGRPTTVSPRTPWLLEIPR
jgi:hypothetical protein